MRCGHPLLPYIQRGGKVVTVPAQQPRSSPCALAFVAEAPSDDEVDKGIPLIGPSGRIFNAILRTAGIDRAECLVTNVFDEQLPNNSVESWCALTKERQTWGEDYKLPPLSEGYLRPQYMRHLTRLAYEINAAKPKVIIPLGATALWAFTGVTGITQSRGAVAYAQHIAPGVKILPTFHPAYVMRQWKMYPVVVGDLLKAQRESEFPEIRPPERTILVPETTAELDIYAKDVLEKADILSVDIETGWGQITCIGFAADKREAMVVPFFDFRKINHSYWPNLNQEIEAWRIVKRLCECPVPKLGQNFLYDAYWLLRKMGIMCLNYREDTRLVHHALYPELPKSLGFMGACYTDQNAWKLMNRRKAEKEDA